MTEENIQTKASALNQILEQASTGGSTWSEKDLRDMLEHQLAVPLATDLVPVVDDAEATLTMEATIADMPESFGDLLAHPEPSIAILRLLKDFAKDLLNREQQEMPKDFLRVLYYAAIVTGLVKRQKRISSLNDSSLRKGCDWCLKQPWITAELRSLFMDGSNVLTET